MLLLLEKEITCSSEAHHLWMVFILHLLQHQPDGCEIFLLRSTLQEELLPVGYIGNPGEVASIE